MKLKAKHRQHPIKDGSRLCVTFAGTFFAIQHKNPLKYESIPARFLCNLTKNLLCTCNITFMRCCLNSLEEYRKEVEELKNEVNKSKINGYKVEVLKNGFDEKFVDYIVYELKDKISENDDFSSLLGKFKKENSQFLKSSRQHRAEIVVQMQSNIFCQMAQKF